MRTAPPAWVFLSGLLIVGSAIASADQPPAVVTVDLLAAEGLTGNAVGPLLVQSDPARDRVVVACTASSALCLLEGPRRAVRTIPLSGRVPQFLKGEALTIRARTGEVYLVGDHCLHVIHPDRGMAGSTPTGEQYEQVAVNEGTGEAYLVSRASGDLLVVTPGRGVTRRVAWAERGEAPRNLNQTPPPSPRKVIHDPGLDRLVAVDGYAATLHWFEGPELRSVGHRRLDLPPGGRWHLAGYDPIGHRLYLVVETDRREVVAAARIDTAGADDLVVGLPRLREGVGITCCPVRQEIYIPYDNDPVLHVVDFARAGRLTEVALPAYGNNAAVLDPVGGRLFVASWAHGEVDWVDLDSRRLVRRYEGLGVLPHMFAMAWHPPDSRVYLLLGATAVNGSFGSAVTALDPVSGRVERLRTGWAPVAMAQLPGTRDRLVVSSEDGWARVGPTGEVTSGRLPVSYPTALASSGRDSLYLAYGPHQSYWPSVYIWGARNGVLELADPARPGYDRRLPRQAHDLVVDRRGGVFALQNNWGGEKQFLAWLPDGVRLFDPAQRLLTEDDLLRETTQRLLRYDPDLDRLYLARVGEGDADPGVLHILDAAGRRVLHRLELGRTPTDMAQDDGHLYVANFDSGTVTLVDKLSFATRERPVGRAPLRVVCLGGRVWALDHRGNSLAELDPLTLAVRQHPLPGPGLPDTLAVAGPRLVVVTRRADEGEILDFDPATGRFRSMHRYPCPYGDTRFDTANAAFYQRGQFADAVFHLGRVETDPDGRLWVIDFLAGRLFLIGPAGVERPSQPPPPASPDATGTAVVAGRGGVR